MVHKLDRRVNPGPTNKPAWQHWVSQCNECMEYHLLVARCIVWSVDMGLTEDQIAELLLELDNDDSSEDFLVREAIDNDQDECEFSDQLAT